MGQSQSQTSTTDATAAAITTTSGEPNESFRSRSFAELLEHIQDATAVASRYECGGRRLVFSAIPAHESQLLLPMLWRSLVTITVSKVGGATDPIEHKYLNYKQFYRLYNLLRHLQEPRDLVERTPDMHSSEEDIISELVRNDDEDGECAICMERKADVVLSCTHAFCSACITAWKQKSHTCPMCRAVADQDDWVLVSSGKSKQELASFLTEYLNLVCNS